MKFHLAVKRALNGQKVSRENDDKSYFTFDPNENSLRRFYIKTGAVKEPRFYSDDVLADDWQVVNG